MKKASNIILLVSMILSIIMAVTFMIIAICSFASAAFIDELKEMAKQYVDQDLDYETMELIIKIYVYTYGICFGVVGLLNIIAAIVASGARKIDAKKSTFISCIVFGCLSGNYACIPGGILGLIAYNKEQKNEPVVVDAEFTE